MRIVPLAVKEYYLHNTPIEETIRNHTDIFDFCLRLKINSKTKGIFRKVDSNFNIIDTELQRTTRYYMSSGLNAGILIKQFDDGKISGVNVGYSAVLFNKFEDKPIQDYKIDYGFYIAEAYKLKNAVDDGQLSLF
jgi:hypothetical protein